MKEGEADKRFTATYRAHEDAVRRYCRRRLLPDDVDDAVLEVFAVVWRRSDQVPADVDATLPWLYAIARNVVRNQSRSRVRLRRLKDRVGEMVDTGTISPETLIVRRSEDRLVLDALESLRPNDREILRLKAWEDLDRNEIARVLRITPEAVDMRIHRALQRMEKALELRGHKFDEQSNAGSERRG